jgi:hypothetical protein
MRGGRKVAERFFQLALGRPLPLKPGVGEMISRTFVILVVCFAAIALADDFKTLNGKEYKNVTTSRVEPDGIGVRFSGGIVKIPFTELPKEVREPRAIYRRLQEKLV